MTKIDKMDQEIEKIKDLLDGLYEGQQEIKDMIRELQTLVDNDTIVHEFDPDEFEND